MWGLLLVFLRFSVMNNRVFLVSFLALMEWTVMVCFFGEFDPGSGRTLAACLTHASRTERLQLAGALEWRTGE